MRGAQLITTPSRSRRFSRACTVPRASRRLRLASSTPTLGWVLNRSRIRPSTSSMPDGTRLVTLTPIASQYPVEMNKVYDSCSMCGANCRIVEDERMTDVLTDTVLTHDEFLAGLKPQQLHELVGLVEYDQSNDT